MAKTNILFPVENLNREIDFRLLLAVLAVNPDRRIFIGHQWVFDSLVDQMRGGVYLGKNFINGIFPHCGLERYEQLKESEFSVVFLDEEGAFYTGGEEEWRTWLDRRLDPEILHPDDFVLAWGDFQADHYRGQNPDLDGQIHATGHPRFDLYKSEFREFFEPEARELRDQFGSFVLVNTNTTYSNHPLGDEHIFENIADEGADDPDWRHDQLDLWATHHKQLADFVRIVYRLNGEFPDLDIVVRPHPSEDHDFYRTAFQSLTDVSVRHEGPVGPWILAAEAVLQEGCTTAVEAYLADKPTIQYQTTDDPPTELPIPKLFGIECHGPEEVSEAVDDILAGRSGVEARIDERARKLFTNFESDSVQPVLDTLDRAEATLSPPCESPSLLQILPREKWRSLRAKLVKPIRPLFARKQRFYEFRYTRFPGFDYDRIGPKFETLQRMFDRKITYTPVNKWLMVVEQ